MQAGTRFTYLEGWVDLVDLIAPPPGVEPAIFRSRVRRRTAAPPRQPHLKKTADRPNRHLLIAGLSCTRRTVEFLINALAFIRTLASSVVDLLYNRCTTNRSNGVYALAGSNNFTVADPESGGGGVRRYVHSPTDTDKFSKPERGK